MHYVTVECQIISHKHYFLFLHCFDLSLSIFISDLNIFRNRNSQGNKKEITNSILKHGTYLQAICYSKCSKSAYIKISRIKALNLKIRF